MSFSSLNYYRLLARIPELGWVIISEKLVSLLYLHNTTQEQVTRAKSKPILILAEPEIGKKDYEEIQEIVAAGEDLVDMEVIESVNKIEHHQQQIQNLQPESDTDKQNQGGGKKMPTTEAQRLFENKLKRHLLNSWQSWWRWKERRLSSWKKRKPRAKRTLMLRRPWKEWGVTEHWTKEKTDESLHKLLISVSVCNLNIWLTWWYNKMTK